MTDLHLVDPKGDSGVFQQKWSGTFTREVKFKGPVIIHGINVRKASAAGTLTVRHGSAGYIGSLSMDTSDLNADYAGPRRFSDLTLRFSGSSLPITDFVIDYEAADD